MPLSFFTEFTFFKGVLYSVCLIYVTFTALAVVFEPFIELPCDYDDSAKTAHGSHPNVLYIHDPCKTEMRHAWLMGMSRQECEFGRHLVVATILGGIIGYERKTADRPAGIRTMSLVGLAAALFTVNSTFVFEAGPMHWDPARVSAAVPSGVGFLGAGLIVKDIYKEVGGEHTHSVKGLNTAASVWLSAAVGVACGGGLYHVATFTAALILVLLRFGPRPLVRTESILGMVLPERHAPPSPEDSKSSKRESMTDVMTTSKRKSTAMKKQMMYD